LSAGIVQVIATATTAAGIRGTRRTNGGGNTAEPAAAEPASRSATTDRSEPATAASTEPAHRFIGRKQTTRLCRVQTITACTATKRRRRNRIEARRTIVYRRGTTAAAAIGDRDGVSETFSRVRESAPTYILNPS
jgi:hypothetical protein